MVRPLTTLGFFVLDRCLGRLRRRRRATLRRETSLSHDARLPSPFSSLSATSCSISHLIISPLRVSRFLASSSSQDEYHQLDSSNDRFFNEVERDDASCLPKTKTLKEWQLQRNVQQDYVFMQTARFKGE